MMCQTNGKNIEVFTAGCYLCDETMQIVRNAKCDECTVTEHNLSKECQCGCLEKSKEYGIKVVPTIVIDGKIVIEGKPTVEQVKKVLGI
jgi:predicted DsbA family dithiol-disulfide isomerase